jgi:hypothetical protein
MSMPCHTAAVGRAIASKKSRPEDFKSFVVVPCSFISNVATMGLTPQRGVINIGSRQVLYLLSSGGAIMKTICKMRIRMKQLLSVMAGMAALLMVGLCFAGQKGRKNPNVA